MTTPTKTSADKATEDLAGSAVLFLLLPFTIPLWGWVVATFWGWFILPLWPHLPRLSVPAAMGLWVCKNALTPVRTGGGDVKWKQAIVTALAAPLFAMFVGWAVHLLMLR